MIIYDTEMLDAGLRSDIDRVIERQSIYADDKIVFSPDWPLYAQLQLMGRLQILVARDEGRFVAYMVGLLHPHINAIDLQVATVSTYYVEERKARGSILRTMFDIMEQLVMTLGARRLYVDTSLNYSCGRLLELMNYKASKITYRKNLMSGEAGHA